MSIKKGNITISGAGTPGIKGDDGFSPIANVSKTGDTATITITDANGTTTATVSDGETYTLPTASTSTLGGVKVDGSTITISDGVISSTGGGSSPVEVLETTENTLYYAASIIGTLNIVPNTWYVIKNTCSFRYGSTTLYFYKGDLVLFLFSQGATTLDGNYFTYISTNYTNPGSFYKVQLTGNNYRYQSLVNSSTPQPYSTQTTMQDIKKYLPTDNTTAYTPNVGSYQPATAKYVDDSISSAIGSINTILATLTTPGNGGE